MAKIVFVCLALISFSFANCNIKTFKVAIDIGHTPKYGGATSASGKKEYFFNKRLAQELLQLMHEKGMKNAFIINPSGKEISLLKRVEIAKAKNAQLFLSVHHDSVQPKYLSFYEKNGKKMHYSNVFSGYSVFYSKYNPQKQKSKKFALLLASELLKNGLSPTLHHAEKIKGENRELVDKNRGVYQFEDLVVLKKATMASVLLESGIIVNQQEEARLNDKDFRKKIIKAIASAIRAYCK